MLPDASVCFDSMSGKKCAAGVSVVVAILPSSCSFLLMVDKLIIIRGRVQTMSSWSHGLVRDICY